MKIFKLAWLVTDGFCQYFSFEWMAIKNQELADSYGISFEYEENTGNKPTHKLSEEERVSARMDSSQKKQKYLEFLDASEVTLIETPDDELLDVSFKLKHRRKLWT